jgi:myo-inositol-1(or 4)-monophosphatase
MTGVVAIPGLGREAHQAIDAVSRALALAGARAGARDVRVKGGRDLVTATDVAVEDAVRDLLAGGRALPVVGEERGGDAPADGSPYWVLDPICGTRNFASGTPLYCVNLALVEGGQVTASAVGDPSTGEILVAERGRGAWALANGSTHRRLAASAESRTIVVEDGKSAGARREHAARFTADAIRADRWDFRSLGTTLALPYVAAGRVSAYVVFVATSTHTAAGSLLVAESGGTVSDVDGRPWTLRSDSIVASATADLHGELLRLARSAAPAPA